MPEPQVKCAAIHRDLRDGRFRVLPQITSGLNDLKNPKYKIHQSLGFEKSSQPMRLRGFSRDQWRARFMLNSDTGRAPLVVSKPNNLIG